MNRWMTLVLFVASTCVVACDEKKPAEPGTTAEKAPMAAPVAIKDEDIAAPVDFDDEAEKDISATNYKAEVDSLEKEISAE